MGQPMALRLQAAWDGRGPLSTLLAPAGWLVGLLARLRRFAHVCGWTAHERLDVPVVVVGNWVAGGAGKTPVTLALVQALRAAGHRPGGNGVAGFSAGDGVLDVTGLGVGRRVLRTQTAPNGDILDLEPVVLLVPAALEARALQFTSMSYVAAAPGSINPYAGSLTPVVEPRLASAVQWYLIASNDQVDTVEYAYLEGMEAPQITTYTDEDTDGVIVKCTHSFGAKATDWRGMARASGT